MDEDAARKAIARHVVARASLRGGVVHTGLSETRRRLESGEADDVVFRYFTPLGVRGRAVREGDEISGWLTGEKCAQSRAPEDRRWGRGGILSDRAARAPREGSGASRS